MSFEDQIPGGVDPRTESPGEEAMAIAGNLVMLVDLFGPRLNQEAVASIVRSVLLWWREKNAGAA